MYTNAPCQNQEESCVFSFASSTVIIKSGKVSESASNITQRRQVLVSQWLKYFQIEEPVEEIEEYVGSWK